MEVTYATRNSNSIDTDIFCSILSDIDNLHRANFAFDVVASSCAQQRTFAQRE
jgi:hypothetical protein